MFGRSLKIKWPRNAFLNERKRTMATVVIQKRKGKAKMSYAVRYKGPNTRATRYYDSYRKLKDAQEAANELRNLIDFGRPSKIHERRTRLSLLSFKEVSRLLKKEWDTRLKLGQLAKKTHEEYVVRVNVLNRVFGHRLLILTDLSEIPQSFKQIENLWNIAGIFNVSHN